MPAIFVVVPILQIIMSAIFTVICLWILIDAANTMTRIVIAPFIIAGLAVFVRSAIHLIRSIIQIRGDKMSNTSALDREKYSKLGQVYDKLGVFQIIADKIYIIGFMIFWFGFLIVFDYFAFQQINKGGMQLLLSSLVFWAVGIFVAYRGFKG